MSIEESNKLIAEFMGGRYEYVEEGSECIDFITKGVLQARVNIKNLKYHSSWDKLMPVVEKIQRLQIREFSKKKPVMDALLDVCIKSLLQSVVVFIQWYSQQSIKPQPEGKGKEGV